MLHSKESQKLQKSRFSISIGVLFTLVIGLIVAMPLVVLTATNLTISSSNTYALLDKLSRTIFSDYENGFEELFAEVENTVDSYVERISINPGFTLEPLGEANFVRGVLAGADKIDALIVVENKDVIFSMARAREDGQSEVPANIVNQVKATKPGWSDEFVDENLSYLVYMKEARLKSGQVVPVIAMVKFKTIADFLSKFAESSNSTAFVLSGDKKLISHSSELIEGKTGSAKGNILAETDDLVIKQFEERTRVDAFKRVNKLGASVTSVDADERRALIITKAFHGKDGIDWLIGIHFSGEEIESEVRLLWWSILISVTAIVFATILAFFVGRWLSQPIKQLFVQANQVTNFDFEKVCELPPSHIRELNEVAFSFNAMLHGIKVFADYVPRSLVLRLISSGVDISKYSEERHLTIMFTDIVGFTAITEGIDAAEAAHMLNDHFDLLGGCVEKCDGTIDKYLGDGMLAFWGAPEELEDHAEKACTAALQMAAGIKEYNIGRREASKPEIRVRIGIHTGKAIVGNIGGKGRVNYTIVGDTVNVCQRLQELGKTVSSGESATIILSNATKNELSTRFDTSDLGSFVLRGREKETKVFLLHVPLN